MIAVFPTQANTLLYRFFRQTLLVFFFLLSFRILEKTPLRYSFYSVESAYLVFLMLFLFVYFFHLLLKGKNFSYLEIFIISLLLIPFYSALMSHVEFGQPFIYGLLAERRWILVLSGLLLFYLLRNKSVSPGDCENAFLIISWLSLISFVLMISILNPDRYSDIEGMTSFSELRGGYRFKFQLTFIVFGVIYYFIKFFQTKKPSDIIAFCIFFGYILLIQQGRSLLVSLILALVIFIFLNLKIREKLILSFYSLYLVIISLFIISLISPDILEKYSALFSNVILFFQGIKTGEPSVDIRLSLVESISRFILSDWRYIIAGVGRLSEQWHEGFFGFLGYFYPSDLGILGVIFLYGLIGFVYVNFQIIILYRYYTRIIIFKSSLFLKALAYYSIAYFIQSLVIGSTFSIPSSSIIIIVLIYYFYYMQKWEGSMEQSKVSINPLSQGNPDPGE